MTFIVFMAKEIKPCSLVLFNDRGEKGHIFMFYARMERTLSTPRFNCLTTVNLAMVYDISLLKRKLMAFWTIHS